ncbi:MAG: hypothetical protein K2W95_30300 [Candidatus Obscuribacterales bacterium]|nr:hypothetical protein [Candidatus Obscuribacterales bacterium]
MPRQQNRSGKNIFAIGFGIALVLFASKGASAAEAKRESRIECKSSGNEQTGDKVAHLFKAKVLTVNVSYKRGIGGAKVSWSANQRPNKIIVELKNFHSLEAFSMCGGEHRFQTALRTAPMIWGRDSTAEPNEHELKPKVNIVQKPDKVVVTVPKEAFDWQVNELQIGWIDAYR